MSARLHKSQVRRLRKLIRAHTDAQVDLAFKGCADPDTWERIELAAKEAKHRLSAYIKYLEKG